MLRVLYINTMAGRKVNYQNLTWGGSPTCAGRADQVGRLYTVWEHRGGTYQLLRLSSTRWYFSASSYVIYQLTCSCLLIWGNMSVVRPLSLRATWSGEFRTCLAATSGVLNVTNLRSRLAYAPSMKIHHLYCWPIHLNMLYPTRI